MATEGLPPNGGASRPPRGTWQAALATVGGAVLSQSPLRRDVTHRHHCPCKREGLVSGLPDLAGLPGPSQTQFQSQTGGEEDTAWTLVWSLGALQTADIIPVGNFGKQARRLSSIRLPSRLKMVFGLGCQRERLYKPLYIAHLFILAGVVYYYFQGPAGKTAPDRDMAEEPSQLEGETLRPVWGPMDKCYPVTTQRRRVKSGKKQASEAMTPKATGGLSSAASTEETELWSQREGEVRPPKEEAASLGPVAKEVAEEQEAAGTLGWEVSRDVGQETVAYPPEVSEEDSEEERPGGWVPQRLWKLWLDWFPAPDVPKTQNHE